MDGSGNLGRSGLANFGTVATGLVQAMQKSTHQLAQGFYSLSTLSTVPYVSLIGHAKSEKIFSWGEVVEVPEGAAVTIKNASFHAGDIVLNGGRDFSTLPQRVTVPVRVTEAPFGLGRKLVTPVWGVDTRRARRAFVALDLDTAIQDTSLILYTGSEVGGSKGGHSHATPAQLVPPVIPYSPASTRIPGYLNTTAIPGATSQGVFPLGFRAADVSPTIPHALLDRGFFVLDAPDTFRKLANIYYILEY